MPFPLARHNPHPDQRITFLISHCNLNILHISFVHTCYTVFRITLFEWWIHLPVKEEPICVRGMTAALKDELYLVDRVLVRCCTRVQVHRIVENIDQCLLPDAYVISYGDYGGSVHYGAYRNHYKQALQCSSFFRATMWYLSSKREK